MAVVGMDPKTVYPASTKLQNASTTLNHAVTAAMGALDNPGDIPQDFVSRAMAIGGQARTCLTSADAFAVHSVDLGDRAKLFEALEKDTPMTAAARGANLDHLKLLWNPAGRHRSQLEPGDYYNDVDTILHPERHQPPSGAKKPSTGCETEGGLDASLSGGNPSLKNEQEADPRKEWKRNSFNEPNEPGHGPAPLGGPHRPAGQERDRPDYKDLANHTLVNEEAGGTVSASLGEKCTADLGHGYTSTSEVKGEAEAHAKAHTNVGLNGVDAGVEGGASVSLTGSETVGNKYGSATVTGGVKAGVSAGADVHAQITDGHLRIGGKISAALGIGGTFGGSIDINLSSILGHGHHEAPKPGVAIGSHASDGSAVISNAIAPSHGGSSGGGGGGAS